MAELKIKCEQPEFIRHLFQDALRERIESLEKGIQRTLERLQEFESLIFKRKVGARRKNLVTHS